MLHLEFVIRNERRRKATNVAVTLNEKEQPIIARFEDNTSSLSPKFLVNLASPSPFLCKRVKLPDIPTMDWNFAGLNEKM